MCPKYPGVCSFAGHGAEKDLHLVIKDIHRVLVVAPNDQMAVLLDVAPGGGQVSAHQLQERALPYRAMRFLICAVPSRHAQATAAAALLPG